MYVNAVTIKFVIIQPHIFNDEKKTKLLFPNSLGKLD